MPSVMLMKLISFVQLNYTRPGLPNFSPELLEAWKNQVKEKGFICCTNAVRAFTSLTHHYVHNINLYVWLKQLRNLALHCELGL